MNEPETNQQTSAGRVADERCLCRETLDQLRDFFGVSPTVRQHLTNSRLEFLKAIRTVIDERIEHIASAGQRGTKVTVE
jgi:hypothetical protein